jgi:hypothetical protein
MLRAIGFVIEKTDGNRLILKLLELKRPTNPPTA